MREFRPPDHYQPAPLRRDGTGMRLNQRALGVHLLGRLYCPRGHYIKDTLAGLQEHTVRCTTLMPASRRGERRTACDILLYTLGDLRARDGTAFTLAVEVTLDEVRHLKSRSLAECLQYLGITWAGERHAP